MICNACDIRRINSSIIYIHGNFVGSDAYAQSTYVCATQYIADVNKEYNTYLVNSRLT